MEKEFHLTAKDLPLPTDAQSLGICSIAEGLTPVKGSVDGSDAGSNYDPLEDTWIIRPEDLLCKTLNGKPVLLGAGELLYSMTQHTRALCAVHMGSTAAGKL